MKAAASAKQELFAVSIQTELGQRERAAIVTLFTHAPCLGQIQFKITKARLIAIFETNQPSSRLPVRKNLVNQKNLI
jgi:hypothetical protein